MGDSVAIDKIIGKSRTSDINVKSVRESLRDIRKLSEERDPSFQAADAENAWRLSYLRVGAFQPIFFSESIPIKFICIFY